jgi:hypothetical protein
MLESFTIFDGSDLYNFLSGSFLLVLLERNRGTDSAVPTLLRLERPGPGTPKFGGKYHTFHNYVTYNYSNTIIIIILLEYDNATTFALCRCLYVMWFIFSKNNSVRNWAFFSEGEV